MTFRWLVVTCRHFVNRFTKCLQREPDRRCAGVGLQVRILTLAPPMVKPPATLGLSAAYPSGCPARERKALSRPLFTAPKRGNKKPSAGGAGTCKGSCDQGYYPRHTPDYLWPAAASLPHFRVNFIFFCPGLRLNRRSYPETGFLGMARFVWRWSTGVCSFWFPHVPHGFLGPRWLLRAPISTLRGNGNSASGRVYKAPDLRTFVSQIL